MEKKGKTVDSSSKSSVDTARVKYCSTPNVQQEMGEILLPSGLDQTSPLGLENAFSLLAFANIPALPCAWRKTEGAEHRKVKYPGEQAATRLEVLTRVNKRRY